MQDSQDDNVVAVNGKQQKVSRLSHAANRMTDSMTAVPQMIGMKQLSDLPAVMASCSSRVIGDVQ